LPGQGAISVSTAGRLLVLMLSPKGGRSLRSRFLQILRREGVGGITRRLLRRKVRA
jgi:hypothetical protein